MSSLVIFQALEPLQPQWPLQPQQPPWPQWPIQPHFIKKMTDTDGWIIPGTTMTNTGPLLWNGYQKIPFFPDIWYLFCRRQLRPVHVLFFQNWLMKLKGPCLLKPLDTIIQENCQQSLIWKLRSLAKIWYPIEVAEVEIAASEGRRSGQGPGEKKFDQKF